MPIKRFVPYRSIISVLENSYWTKFSHKWTDNFQELIIYLNSIFSHCNLQVHSYNIKSIIKEHHSVKDMVCILESILFSCYEHMDWHHDHFHHDIEGSKCVSCQWFAEYPAALLSKCNWFRIYRTIWTIWTKKLTETYILVWQLRLVFLVAQVPSLTVHSKSYL